MNRYYCIILNFEKLTPTAILLKVGIGQASLDKVKVSLAGKVVSSQSASALAALLLLEMILACVADNNTTAAGNLITLSGRLEQRKRNPVRTVFNIMIIYYVNALVVVRSKNLPCESLTCHPGGRLHTGCQDLLLRWAAVAAFGRQPTWERQQCR